MLTARPFTLQAIRVTVSMTDARGMEEEVNDAHKRRLATVWPFIQDGCFHATGQAGLSITGGMAISFI